MRGGPRGQAGSRAGRVWFNLAAWRALMSQPKYGTPRMRAEDHEGAQGRVRPRCWWVPRLRPSGIPRACPILPKEVLPKVSGSLVAHCAGLDQAALEPRQVEGGAGPQILAAYLACPQGVPQRKDLLLLGQEALPQDGHLGCLGFSPRAMNSRRRWVQQNWRAAAFKAL